MDTPWEGTARKSRTQSKETSLDYERHKPPMLAWWIPCLPPAPSRWQLFPSLAAQSQNDQHGNPRVLQINHAHTDSSHLQYNRTALAELCACFASPMKEERARRTKKHTPTYTPLHKGRLWTSEELFSDTGMKIFVKSQLCMRVCACIWQHFYFYFYIFILHRNSFY